LDAAIDTDLTAVEAELADIEDFKALDEAEADIAALDDAEADEEDFVSFSKASCLP